MSLTYVEQHYLTFLERKYFLQHNLTLLRVRHREGLGWVVLQKSRASEEVVIGLSEEDNPRESIDHALCFHQHKNDIQYFLCYLNRTIYAAPSRSALKQFLNKSFKGIKDSDLKKIGWDTTRSFETEPDYNSDSRILKLSLAVFTPLTDDGLFEIKDLYRV